MTESRSAKAYLSYAHHDSDLVRRLETHLSPLLREGTLEAWNDRKIRPGERWDEEIDRRLKSADIILLLVSADFLASDYCFGTELKQALAMHDAGEAIVVPIILRPCDWKGAPFASLQALPRDGKPISLHEDQDAVLLDTVREIRRIANTREPSEGLDRDRSIEVRLNVEFESFSKAQERTFLEAVRVLLGLDTDIKIVTKRKGSVILRLRLSRAEVERLQQATKRGELDEYKVVDAEVVLEEDQEESTRPRVFIGSSVEGLEVAETIQLSLDHLCEVTLWTQDIFSLSSSTLESLANKLHEFDYAILVLTPDDLTESRGDILLSPRDNVVFELGLFMGHLGRERTILVYDRTADLKIPSDLAGVTAATYQPHTSGNLDAALGAPCTRLKKHIRSLGARGT